jgi:hypothetical protein
MEEALKKNLREVVMRLMRCVCYRLLMSVRLLSELGDMSVVKVNGNYNNYVNSGLQIDLKQKKILTAIEFAIE